MLFFRMYFVVFPWLLLRFFPPLYMVFSSLTVMCLLLVFFEFILLGVHSLEELYGHYYFRYFFNPFYSFSRTLFTDMLVCVILTHRL